MLSLLLLVFVFVTTAIVFALAVLGVIIFRKKSTQSSPRIDQANVIDVTPKNEQ
jgi:hypothetical protein